MKINKYYMWHDLGTGLVGLEGLVVVELVGLVEHVRHVGFLGFYVFSNITSHQQMTFQPNCA